MFDRLPLRKIYIATLSATAFFIPLSEWLLSLGIILLIAVWMAGRGFTRIDELVKSQKTILIFLVFYSVYLIWMANTTDISYGIHELRLKLPLLVFPLIIGLSDPLTGNEIKTVLTIFICGVIISTMAGVYYYTTFDHSSDIIDPREISIFISNVRLALLTDLSIAVSAWYYFTGTPGSGRIFYLIAAVWLTIFLFILLSVTGIVILFILITLGILRICFKEGRIILKIGSLFILLSLYSLSAIFIVNEIRHFYLNGNKYKFPLEEKTISGNSYQHYGDRKEIENGNLVWVYISEDEMRKEWNLLSSLKYDSLDRKGQEIKYTIIRYLSSAGLKKDSVGLSSLSVNDIKFIENGITNKLFTSQNPIKTKIYEIIWQIDSYIKGANPSGHSVTQRIEFLKTGWHLFLRNFFIGTGTGDHKNEMMSQYDTEKSDLYPVYRLLPHNQYLTLLVSFGFTGMIIIAAAIVLPVYIEKRFRSFLFNIFMLIIVLSMFGEDTLETHTGVSFFAFFYSLFVFGTGKVNFKVC